MSGFKGWNHHSIKFEFISPNSESTGCKGFLSPLIYRYKLHMIQWYLLRKREHVSK